MKKTLLIASIVAMAMGAQTQPSDFLSKEWNNPFEEYGAFNYVQRQCDGELGKWFIPTYAQNDYPVIQNYHDTAKIEIAYYYDFVIVLDIRDMFPNKNGNNEVNVKFKVSHEYDAYDLLFIIYTHKENKNLVENHFNICLDKENTFFKFESINMNIKNGDYAYGKAKIDENDNFITVRISSTNSRYLSDIEITGTNGLEKKDKKYKEYFKYNYFNEVCLFSDLEKNNNEDIKTEINNNMESNTYVSNNVLHTDEPSSVYIFNASGILVKTENNTTSVDLSDLKKGVYIAKVNGTPIRFVR